MAEIPSRGQGSFASPKFVAAAVAVAALLVGLVWVFADRDRDPEAASPEAAASEPASASGADARSASTSEGDDGASTCGLASSDMSVPSMPIPSVPVAVGEQMTVPSLPGAGPGVIPDGGGISYCFAHTPTGAVLAAANFFTWFSSNQQLPDVVLRLMEDSPARDSLVSQVDAGWSGQTASPAVIQGFQFEDRGPDHALVVLAVSTVAYPDQLVAWPVPLAWQDGDWKAVVPASESWGERPIQSLDIEGFVPWGA